MGNFVLRVFNYTQKHLHVKVKPILKQKLLKTLSPAAFPETLGCKGCSSGLCQPRDLNMPRSRPPAVSFTQLSLPRRTLPRPCARRSLVCARPVKQLNPRPAPPHLSLPFQCQGPPKVTLHSAGLPSSLPSPSSESVVTTPPHTPLLK